MVLLVMLTDAALDEEEPALFRVLDALLVLFVEADEKVATLHKWTLSLSNL